MRNLDLLGQNFGHWTVVSLAGSKPYGGRAYLCRCRCGAERAVSAVSLRKGDSTSCGCYAIRHERNAARGLYSHPLRRIHDGMKARCFKAKHIYFPYYGGRGITICDRWLTGDGEMDGFACFVADMGARPTRQHMIERKDNDGNYEPDNCTWATRAEQNRNRSNTIKMTLGDATKPLVTWARELSLSPHALRQRRDDGWSDERALTTPVR